MKIALVCGNHIPQSKGGSMVSAEAIAWRLGSNWDVELVCGRSEPTNPHAPFIVRQLSPFPYLSFHPEPGDSVDRQRGARALRRYFDRCSHFCAEQQYAVVDAQGPWCESASVVTVRFVYREYLDALARSGCEWSESDSWHKALLELEHRSISAATVKRYIAVSTKTQAELERHYGIKPSHVTVINNGVDVSTYSLSRRAQWRAHVRNVWSVAPEDVVLCYCGDNFIRKNLRVHGGAEG